MTAPAADPHANKDVVQRWFALGLSTPEALDLVRAALATTPAP